jgi:hypothetical protein
MNHHFIRQLRRKNLIFWHSFKNLKAISKEDLSLNIRRHERKCKLKMLLKGKILNKNSSGSIKLKLNFK